jgi:glutaminyl-peptide cyclotransferase
MDADVEMNDKGFSGHGVFKNRTGNAVVNGVATESSIEFRGGRPSKCFVCAMTVLILGVFAYSGISYNRSVENIEAVDGAYNSETEEFQAGVSPKLVAEGMTRLKPPHRSRPSTSIPATPEQNQSNEASLTYQDWLDATVTLRDGKMYEVVEQLAHGKGSFTEGLAYANGKLYESVGLNRRSAILELDPRTGETIDRIDMEKKYFGEGLTYVDGKLIQLTYKHKTGFIYDTADLKIPARNFSYSTTTGEGWGMTYDNDRDEIIVSDGSDNLLFWDPYTFVEKRKVPVLRMSGKPAVQINELEYWRGRVIANVWYEDSLLVIHPETGIVEKEYDFSSLWPNPERIIHGADVLNGIAVSDVEDILYITGKNWDRMFKVRYVGMIDGIPFSLTFALKVFYPSMMARRLCWKKSPPFGLIPRC